MALSAPITELSQLPLLHTVRIVSLGSFLERIDPLIVLLLIIALYTKLTMRYLGAVVTLMQLIPKLDRRWFVVAVGALMYFTSFLEPNYPYHIWLGVEISTLRIFPFFQIVFPALLLAIVKLKRTSAPTGS
jgi:spore germination protein KB